MKVNSIDKLGLLAGLLLPFAGLVRSIKRFRIPASKYVFIVFCAFYGTIFVYQKKDIGIGLGSDASRYAIVFSNSNSIRDVGFIEFYKKLDDHDKLDFYNPVIIYLLSRITGDPHVYFMVIVLVFGIFYANNIWDIISMCKNRFVAWSGIVLIVFSLICSLDTIGGVRMQTGFHVFFFGLFSYLINGDKKRLIWVPLSGLFHFSLFYLVALAGFFLLIRNINTWIFFIFFLIAHLINELDLEFVHNLFAFMPEDVNERLTIYARAEKIQMLKESGKFFLGASNLWARIDTNVLRFFVLLETIIIFLPGNNNVVKKPEYRRILNFSLFLYGFSLIVANLPSGYRFITISSMFFFAFYAVLFNQSYDELTKWVKLSLKIAFPFFLIFIVKIARMILDTTSLYLFVGNFFSSFLLESNVTIIDMLKRVI